tara:strand:- start:501 stop:923 length:423 start_codon:yes stop_codon:yes gene_type:complete
MPDENTVVSIGEAAEASGTSTPTIRYYEEISLIPPARRSAAGHRHYTRPDINRLTFIRRCRDLGFGIGQVRVLSGLSASPDEDCTAVRDIAADRLSSVRRKLDELHRLEEQLAEFVEACDRSCCGGASRDCVVLAELAHA